MNQILELHCQGCGKLITNASNYLEYHGFKACTEPCLNKIKSLPLWENVFDVSAIDGKTIHGMLRRGLKRKGYQITKVQVLNVAHFQMKANILFSIELVEGAEDIKSIQVDDATYVIGKTEQPQPKEVKPKELNREKAMETRKIKVEEKRMAVYENKIFKFKEPSPTYYQWGRIRTRTFGETTLKVMEVLKQYDGQPVNNIHFSEIANELGVSRQRVHQIFQQILA